LRSPRQLHQKFPKSGPPVHKLVKWRTGSEARISCLKRDFGWQRTLFDGIDGA